MQYLRMLEACTDILVSNFSPLADIFIHATPIDLSQCSIYICLQAKTCVKIIRMIPNTEPCRSAKLCSINYSTEWHVICTQMKQQEHHTGDGRYH